MHPYGNVLPFPPTSPHYWWTRVTTSSAPCLIRTIRLGGSGGLGGLPLTMWQPVYQGSADCGCVRQLCTRLTDPYSIDPFEIATAVSTFLWSSYSSWLLLLLLICILQKGWVYSRTSTIRTVFASSKGRIILNLCYSIPIRILCTQKYQKFVRTENYKSWFLRVFA